MVEEGRGWGCGQEARGGGRAEGEGRGGRTRGAWGACHTYSHSYTVLMAAAVDMRSCVVHTPTRFFPRGQPL